MQLLATQVTNSWIVDTSLTRPVGEISDIILDPEKFFIRYIAISIPGEKATYYVRGDHLQWKANVSLIRSASLVGQASDFVRDQSLIQQKCNPVGYRILDEQKRVLGRVYDFSFSSDHNRLERLMIHPIWWQSIWQSDRVVSRTAIRDVNTRKRTITIDGNRAKVSNRAVRPIPA